MLINGLFASLESYDEIAKNLSEEFNILRYDCRGQGESECPKEESYSLSDHVLDLFGLVEEHIDEEVFLLGLSNGGRIALEFASLYPEKTLGVIACDTYEKPSVLLKHKLSSWLKAFEVGGAYHRFDIATPWVWGESLVEEKPELVEIYRKRAEDIDAHAVVALIKGAMKSEIEIERITCPVQLIVGEEDLLTPPFKHKAIFSALKNNNKLNEYHVIPGGHASILEYPISALEVIKPFLRSVK